METNKPKKKMTPQQRKFLLARLGNRWQNAPERPEPAAVKRARAVLVVWGKRERARQRKLQPAFRAAFDQAHQAVLFGTAEEAIAAVEAFEVYRSNFGR